MRDVQRFFFRAAEVYILCQYCRVKRVSTLHSGFSVKPVGHSHYGKYNRGTRWFTAQSRSEVTVPILRATRFAGRIALPSVP